MAVMYQRYPGGEFEIQTRTSDQLERQLSRGQLDLAVSARIPLSVDLESEPLCQEKIALFVPANHRLANKASLQIPLKNPIANFKFRRGEIDPVKETFLLRGVTQKRPSVF